MDNYQQELMFSKIINEFSKTVELFNLSTSDARLFAFLYLHKKPLTLDEMSEALGKSKTSVSTSTRSLVDLNLATRVWKKGVRKDLYQTSPHLFQSFINASVTRWIDFADQQRNTLEELLAVLQSDESSKRLEEPLQSIIKFHQQIEEAFQKMKSNEHKQ